MNTAFHPIDITVFALRLCDVLPALILLTARAPERAKADAANLYPAVARDLLADRDKGTEK